MGRFRGLVVVVLVAFVGWNAAQGSAQSAPALELFYHAAGVNERAANTALQERRIGVRP